jgi:hypothetical protein
MQAAFEVDTDITSFRNTLSIISNGILPGPRTSLGDGTIVSSKWSSSDSDGVSIYGLTITRWLPDQRPKSETAIRFTSRPVSDAVSKVLAESISQFETYLRNILRQIALDYRGQTAISICAAICEVELSPITEDQAVEIILDESLDSREPEFLEKPWEAIPEGRYRDAVKLWNYNHKCADIAQEVEREPGTVGNWIVKLRKEYGRKIVPYDEDRKKFFNEP